MRQSIYCKVGYVVINIHIMFYSIVKQHYFYSLHSLNILKCIILVLANAANTTPFEIMSETYEIGKSLNIR